MPITQGTKVVRQGNADEGCKIDRGQQQNVGDREAICRQELLVLQRRVKQAQRLDRARPVGLTPLGIAAWQCGGEAVGASRRL